MRIEPALHDRRRRFRRSDMQCLRREQSVSPVTPAAVIAAFSGSSAVARPTIRSASRRESTIPVHDRFGGAIMKR
jgi:hypothetical protein